jgi:purine-binding chemotaxis protein CheW
MLADQLCGIELSRVRELLGYMTFAPANGTHPTIVGTFELRGRLIRVLDLRLRFALPATRTDDTVMIIVEFDGQIDALIVDNVRGLENLGAIESNAVPKRSRIDARFTAGTARVGDATISLLDLANVLVITPPLPKAA